MILFFLLVSHEAISTGNPEILSLVLQHRDFQRGSQRLAGIPELLDELNAVSLSRGWILVQLFIGWGQTDINFLRIQSQLA